MSIFLNERSKVIVQGITGREGLYHANRMRAYGTKLVGGVTPGVALAGIMPGHVFSEGHVGLISRSGTLTYEIVDQLTRAGIGQSTCVGIGGDPIIGSVFVDCLLAFEQDDKTEAVVLVGEIGGTDEEDAAQLVADKKFSKPLVTFIGGRSAPKGKRMGHAGAIITGSMGTPESKVAAFQKIGAPVADSPADIPGLVARVLKQTAKT